MTEYRHNDGVTSLSEEYKIPEDKLITDTGWLKPIALQLGAAEMYLDLTSDKTAHLFWLPESKRYRVVVNNSREEPLVIMHSTRLNRARHLFHVASMAIRHGGEWQQKFDALVAKEAAK